MMSIDGNRVFNTEYLGSYDNIVPWQRPELDYVKLHCVHDITW